MAELPERDNTVDLIYKYWESRDKDPRRPHLGGSRIGQECERMIWYEFRWVNPTGFPGRILRLFDRGFREEDVFVKELRKIGVDVREVDPQTGRQYRFEKFGGHFSGSLDGICKGLKEAPNTPHLLEFKTSNDKFFKELQKKGVKEAKKYDHYPQMQVYMGEYKLKRAAYFVTNKNTDDIHYERVEFNKDIYEKLLEKARRIIFTDRPPGRISENPNFYKCKWCSQNNICFAKQKPDLNCRTCIHVTPKEDGTWQCEKLNKALTVDEQKRGCMHHLFNPHLIPAEQVDAGDDWIQYEDPKGKLRKNLSGGRWEV